MGEDYTEEVKMKYKKELSVVISSWNRGYALRWVLPNLLDQEIPPDEIVIVDDGSNDRTERIVKKFQQVYPEANIKYYYNDNPGYSTCTWGNNCAIRKATKEIVMVTGADFLHPTNDVKIVLEHFEKPENDRTIIFGHQLYFVYELALQNLTKEQLLDPISITKLPIVHTWHEGYISPPDTITYCKTGAMHHICGILKKHLMAVGGYDENYAILKCTGGEDHDLFRRLNLYGIKQIQSKDIIPIHLGHSGPPPEWMTQEKWDLAAKVPKADQWKANLGREWGILKERDNG